jgi:hypothetical protein
MSPDSMLMIASLAVEDDQTKSEGLERTQIQSNEIETKHARQEMKRLQDESAAKRKDADGGGFFGKLVSVVGRGILGVMTLGTSLIAEQAVNLAQGKGIGFHKGVFDTIGDWTAGIFTLGLSYFGVQKPAEIELKSEADQIETHAEKSKVQIDALRKEISDRLNDVEESDQASSAMDDIVQDSMQSEANLFQKIDAGIAG